MLQEIAVGTSAAWRSGTDNVVSTKNPIGQRLINLIGSGNSIEIIYQRPEQIPSRRIIKPLRLFRKSGMHVIYVEAYCEVSLENRIFELSWITLC